MKILKNLLLPGLHGKPLLTDIFYKETGLPKPVVIFSHGFKGFKDWGHFNLMAKAFAEAGFVFVKFNFGFNGTAPENPGECTDMEAFGNNNLTKELDDLGVVIDYVLNNADLKKEVNPDKLFLMGHSRGGGITILKAGEDSRVKGIVILASVGEFGTFWNEEQVREWKKTGVVYVENSRTKIKMPIYYQYYENYTANLERLSIRNAVEKLAIPFLAIHGTNDIVVPYTAAEKFRQWNPSVKVLLIENSDHTFGGKHPFKGDELPADVILVTEATIKFLNEV